MRKTAEDPHCLTAGVAPGLLDNFKKNNEALEGIAKGLETFLEVRTFPSWFQTSHIMLLSLE